MKRLVGPRTSSHGGKYVCWRKGLLDEIPHVRLIRGVILLRTEDARKVAARLEQLQVEVHARTVVLTPDDLRALGTSSMYEKSFI